MRTKRHSFFIDFAQFVEAEHLEPAGVGQDRPRPRHEPMQPAHAPHRLHPRSQVQVIGVAENNLRPQFFERVLGDSLYRRQRADRHKHRRFNFGVRGDQASCTGFAACGFDPEVERHAVEGHGRAILTCPPRIRRGRRQLEHFQVAAEGMNLKLGKLRRAAVQRLSKSARPASLHDPDGF